MLHVRALMMYISVHQNFKLLKLSLYKLNSKCKDPCIYFGMQNQCLEGCSLCILSKIINQ